MTDNLYYFENFKSFSQAKLSLFQSKFTLLIGPNGSGKSNLLDAIKLLSFLAHGGSLHDVTDINKGGQLEIRGGLPGCTRYGQTAFTLGFSAHIHIEAKRHDFDYRLTIETQQSPKIINESLYIDNRLFFEVKSEQSHSSQPLVSDKYLASSGKKPALPSSTTKSFLSQYHPKNVAGNQIINRIINNFQNLWVLEPNPKLIRHYEHIGNTIISQNGSNLSAVLYALSQGNQESQESLQRLLEWIAQLPNEPYQRFEFVTVPQLNDVILGLVENHTDKFISAGLLSDGTLRCLAMLTALETATPGSWIIVEEFDNGLHPSRVGIMVKAIVDCCKRHDLKVLVTTHNQATLNALSQEELNGVILCHPDSQNHSTNLITWPDLPYQQELLERGSLGDLVTHQRIDQYLNPDFEEKRKQKALAWLADF